MIKKQFKELTPEELRIYRRCWTEVLDTYCRANEYTGNRPCDNGVMCDRCHYDPVLKERFRRKLKSFKLEIVGE